MSLLPVVEACDNFSLDTTMEELTPFFIKQHTTTPIGYLFPHVLSLLQKYNASQERPPFEITPQQVSFASHLSGFQDLTSAMKQLCESWRDTGEFGDVIGGRMWRSELYTVYEKSPFRDLESVAFAVERSCCPIFGFVVYGVHLTMYTPDMRIWVGRRAKSKQTWPGYLDNAAAGGMPHGTSPREAFLKECYEEASMPQKVAERATGVGALSYFYRNAKGYLQPEIQYVYDLCLPPDDGQGNQSVDAFTPRPSDGEVESFELLNVDDVLAKMKAGKFKPNCAIVLLGFFIRHGIVTPENEPNYLEIWTRMHGRHGFDAFVTRMAKQGGNGSSS
ncbi:hypothetical protein FRB94_005034 [Tulasnella sp. JGI-2019a]|nr:hypothetical protein FRB94_005034 [Tulasnella sp. JGI-2019a]KAG9008175.1 hypothetical protein FRB93_006743 [Tulasnella sp. JGI-2019a]KAG9024192.1 hypothetical protein FRB95_011964 [Tulasnella sp. JGI-2019a]